MQNDNNRVEKQNESKVININFNFNGVSGNLSTNEFLNQIFS